MDLGSRAATGYDDLRKTCDRLGDDGRPDAHLGLVDCLKAQAQASYLPFPSRPSAAGRELRRDEWMSGGLPRALFPRLLLLPLLFLLPLLYSSQVRADHKSGSFYGRRASGGGTCSELSSELASGSVAVLVQLARSGGLFSTNFISGVRPTVPSRSHLGWHSTPTVVLSTQAQAQASAFKLWAEAGAGA